MFRVCIAIRMQHSILYVLILFEVVIQESVYIPTFVRSSYVHGSFKSISFIV